MRKLLATALSFAIVAGSSPAVSQESTLRVAIPSTLNTLDPAKTKIGEEYIFIFLVYSGLTELTATGEVLPDLAESWEANDDFSEWTFFLRQGVTFHDGSAFDAEDVRATIERIMDPATASTARVNFQIVDDIVVVDDHTIRFSLSQSYAGFPELMGDRHVRIVPSELSESLAAEPIGTGPYRLREFQPGNRVVLERFEDYYNEDLPNMDTIILQIIPERSTQFAALQTGEVHLLWDITPEMILEHREASGIVIDSVPTSTWDGLIMNANQPPFDDQRVRLAVSLAVDKRALTEIALFGTGTPTLTMIPPSHPFYNDDIEIGVPDLERSRQLLAQAGYPAGFDITLYVPAGRPTRERLGLGAAEMLGQVGIRVEIQRVPWDRFVTEIEGHAPFFTDGFYSRPTIDASIYPWYHSQGSWNSQLWHYGNEEMDAVLEAARAAGSNEERREHYREFQRLAVAYPAGIIPYVLNHANAYTDRLQNFNSHPMMWLDLRSVNLN
jgi:peptide/nickel transport system substrate-binding protein